MGISGKFETVITNSTISSNRAMNGGGLFLAGNNIGNDLPGSIEIRHSTITGNTAGPFDPVQYDSVGGDGYAITVGGGIAVTLAEFTYEPPIVLLDHTIVAGNNHQQKEPIHLSPSPHSDEDLNESPDIGLDPAPSELFGGFDHLNPEPLPPTDPYYHMYTFNAYYALIGDEGAHVFYKVLAIDGIYDVDDPRLGPLTNNGGFTLPDGNTILTHEPHFGSPAIDAGDPGATANAGTVPEFDQRGAPFTRVFDGDGDTIDEIDIGAVEVQPAPEAPCPPGDYNDDDTVDAADYVVWRKTLGTSFDLPNEDPTVTPGMVTEGDYDVWVEHFGEVCVEEIIAMQTETAEAPTAIGFENDSSGFDKADSTNNIVRESIGLRHDGALDRAQLTRSSHQRQIVLAARIAPRNQAEDKVHLILSMAAMRRDIPQVAATVEQRFDLLQNELIELVRFDADHEDVQTVLAIERAIETLFS